MSSTTAAAESAADVSSSGSGVGGGPVSRVLYVSLNSPAAAASGKGGDPSSSSSNAGGGGTNRKQIVHVMCDNWDIEPVSTAPVSLWRIESGSSADDVADAADNAEGESKKMTMRASPPPKQKKPQQQQLAMMPEDPGTSDPLESSVLEDLGLKSFAEMCCSQGQGQGQDEVFAKYLKRGYEMYVDWYVSILEQHGVSDEFKGKALYSFARSITELAKESGSNAGFEIDVARELHRSVLSKSAAATKEKGTAAAADPPIKFDNAAATEAYSRVLGEYIQRIPKGAQQQQQEEGSISPAAAASAAAAAIKSEIIAVIKKYVDQYTAAATTAASIRKWHRRLLELNKRQVSWIVSKCPHEVLAKHSARTWRGTESLLPFQKMMSLKIASDNSSSSGSVPTLVIDVAAISAGEPFVPLPGYHVGLCYLESVGALLLSPPPPNGSSSSESGHVAYGNCVTKNRKVRFDFNGDELDGSEI